MYFKHIPSCVCPITIQEKLHIFADFMEFAAIIEAINYLIDTNIYRTLMAAYHRAFCPCCPYRLKKAT